MPQATTPWNYEMVFESGYGGTSRVENSAQGLWNIPHEKEVHRETIGLESQPTRTLTASGVEGGCDADVCRQGGGVTGTAKGPRRHSKGCVRKTLRRSRCLIATWCQAGFAGGMIVGRQTSGRRVRTRPAPWREDRFILRTMIGKETLSPPSFVNEKTTGIAFFAVVPADGERA